LPEVFCDTSPLQYLHQLGLLHLLPALVERITVPPAVVAELETGLSHGVNLPDITALPWVTILSPASAPVLRLAGNLGPGESGTLALALEAKDALVIVDDGLARQIAGTLNLRIRGTLGILVDAKRKGLIPAVAPFLDQLDQLRFRVAPQTRKSVLEQAGE
jgi:predicted nucleic acid-binding protein